MHVNVLLSGRLKIDGYGQRHAECKDGTLRLRLRRRSRVADVITNLDVPAQRVSMTMLNGRQCRLTAALRDGDRVVLIPEDVALLWRALGRQNLGIGIGHDS